MPKKTPEAAAAADSAADQAAEQNADAVPGVEMVQVRALIDMREHDAVAGLLCSVPADQLAALKAAGFVDDHPDAIAYAASLA